MTNLLEREILEIVAEHGSGGHLDDVAIFMLLNTVAGGHYAERYDEAAIGSALRDLLAAGRIEAGGTEPSGFSAHATSRTFTITDAGRTALQED